MKDRVMRKRADPDRDRIGGGVGDRTKNSSKATVVITNQQETLKQQETAQIWKGNNELFENIILFLKNERTIKVKSLRKVH